MKIRLALVGLAGLWAALPLVGGSPGTGSAAAANQSPPVFNIASETYYRLDVAGGTIAVRMEAEISPGKGELTTVALWAMPGATNVLLKQDDAPLEPEITAAVPEKETPAVIKATLAKPVKNSLRSKILLTYDVPAQQNPLTSVERGVVESQFVSQGPGSFVFIDMPVNGDNYVEPGCLRAADQPKSVKDSGYERWVCGDALTIALSTEEKEVQQQCAALSDRCRQRAVVAPFAGYAQSITDDAKKGLLEGEITLARGPVRISLKYFRADAAWAQEEFEAAKKALPLLEEAFGRPYPHDVVNLRQSRFIEWAGAAGVAFPDEGQMLLARTGVGTFDNEVTVHELAHQWAGRNLKSNWLWEGLAEYGMKAVAPAMGFTPSRAGQWEQLGYKDPLATWYNGSAVYNADYWYGKAGAFWLEFEKAVGGRENMRVVLGQMDDQQARWPLDGTWFMDAGEQVSGANLDELFLSWVFARERAAPLLAERRAAYDQVKAFLADAAAGGLVGTPTDLQAMLDSWQFGGIADLLATGKRAVTEYAAVRRLAAEAGLELGTTVAQEWAKTSVGQSLRLMTDQSQAITAITRAANELAGQAEGAPSLAQLSEARLKYAEGDFSEAERLASASTTTAYNQVAAARLIELTKETQRSYKPSFLGRVGLYFRDPAGDLAEAEAAYAEGDPNRALERARSAYDGWNGAQRRGLMRLAILAGVMCLLSVGTWYLLRRLDPDRKRARPVGGGHVLTEEARSGWRDWDSNSLP